MKIFFVILFLLPSLLLAQTESRVTESKIQGTWKARLDGVELTLVLNADGSGSFDGDKIKYTLQNGKIIVTIVSESETLSYDYVLNNNSLTVSGGDLEDEVIFTRPGATVENRSKVPDGKTSGTQDQKTPWR